MLNKILDNTVLSIATTISALLALLNSFTISFGAPAFWSDLIITVITMYTTIHWAFFIWGELKSKERVMSLDGVEKERIPLKILWKKIGPSIVLLPVLIILLVWNAIPPLRHIGHTNWTLCGSFTRNCNERICLVLRDARGRPISDECFRTDDDSGYKYLLAPHWWTYTPQKVALRCDSNTSEWIELSPSFFDRTCEARLDLR